MVSDVVVNQFESFCEQYGAGVQVSNPEAVLHVCETIGEFDELVSWIEAASEEEYAEFLEER